MDSISGLCKWMGKVSDEWFSPPPSPTLLLCPQSPSTGDIDIASSGRDLDEELGSSLSPLHSSREILAGYSDVACKARHKNRSTDPNSRNRSYSTLPLAEDEME